MQRNPVLFLRPQSLLARIFWAFWIAMTVSGLVLLALETARAEKLNKRWRGVTSDAFAFYATSIAKDQEENEAGQAREFLSDLHKRAGIRAWLFSEAGREVSGYAASVLTAESKWLRNQMEITRQQSLRGGATVFNFQGAITIAAHTATAPHGRRYTLVGILPAARFGSWEALPQTQALRLISILSVAALVSWLLSRQITAPIQSLRLATQRLASGDLSARASVPVHGKGDELAQLAYDFDSMAERIENLLREQENFVGAQRRLVRDVSHELRSPLARLSVALELARDAVAEQSEAGSDKAMRLHAPLDRIEREAGRLGEMLDRMLILARLDSGVLPPETTLLDLAPLARVIVADADFEARSLHRHVTLNQCEACLVQGTHDLLRSAIENVVRNALHHTPENSTVTVTLRRDNHWGVLEVCDEGPGLPTSELSAIFQPFYRASTSRDRKSGGSGLGLAITQRAIEVHGGQVCARNTMPHGLCVELRLPIQSG